VPLVSITGDFTQTSTCLLPLLGVSTTPDTCTVTVRFTPTSTGVRTGTLSGGLGGPVAQLSGRGVGPVVLDPPKVKGTCAKGGKGKGGKKKGKKGRRAKPCKPNKKPKKK
jgi:hypothetical protein